MNKRGFRYLMGLLVSLLAVGLACGSPSPTQEPAAEEQPTEVKLPPTEEVVEPAGDEWITFTDESDYLAIDIPADWTYGQDRDEDNDYWYWDYFQSPDEHAGVESVVFDDGTSWTGSQSGKQALYMLHQFYSDTGEEGDIRISDDSIQKDGSERLTWSSRSGDYSGISFFEVRKKTAFLMFTVWWDDDYEEQYGEILDDVISSYRTP